MPNRRVAVILSCAVIVALAAGCGGHEKPTAPDPPHSELLTLTAATFSMGSPAGEAGRRPDETVHQVTLTRGFQIGRHEVTQAEWQSAMGWVDAGFRGSDRPVERVTWFDCVDYCNRCSIREGLSPAYSMEAVVRSGKHITSAIVAWDRDAGGYRLPTEAEWEYACRAESPSAFCNGGISVRGTDPSFPICERDPNLDQVGWFCDNAAGVTQVVGTKASNRWGLQDLHGNVQEWCWDWYGPLASEPALDPEGPAAGAYRSVRGGSWSSLAGNCRSAFRYRESPAGGTHAIGLRVVRMLP